MTNGCSERRAAVGGAARVARAHLGQHRVVGVDAGPDRGPPLDVGRRVRGGTGEDGRAERQSLPGVHGAGDGVEGLPPPVEVWDGDDVDPRVGQPLGQGVHRAGECVPEHRDVRHHAGAAAAGVVGAHRDRHQLGAALDGAVGLSVESHHRGAALRVVEVVSLQPRVECHQPLVDRRHRGVGSGGPRVVRAVRPPLGAVGVEARASPNHRGHPPRTGTPWPGRQQTQRPGPLDGRDGCPLRQCSRQVRPPARSRLPARGRRWRPPGGAEPSPSPPCAAVSPRCRERIQSRPCGVAGRHQLSGGRRVVQRSGSVRDEQLHHGHSARGHRTPRPHPLCQRLELATRQPHVGPARGQGTLGGAPTRAACTLGVDASDVRGCSGGTPPARDRASADLREAGRAAGASVARRPDGRSRRASAAGRSLADHLLRRDNGAERSSEGVLPASRSAGRVFPSARAGYPRNLGSGVPSGRWRPSWPGTAAGTGSSGSAGSSLDGESVQREVIADLQRVIGFDRWCVPQADPDTLLPGVGIADHDYGPGLPRALELEYSGTDFAAKHDVARRARLASSLVAETGGDLARSPRWDEVLRPVGIGDIAAVACRDASGCWGWIEAYRDASERAFSDDDLDLLAAAGASMSVTLRRSIVGVRREDPDRVRAAGCPGAGPRSAAGQPHRGGHPMDRGAAAGRGVRQVGHAAGGDLSGGDAGPRR